MNTPRNIGISTAWNAFRYESGREMVQELLELGFDTLELNVHVTENMIEDVLGIVKQGQVRVCSLHNYCPLPEGIERKAATKNILPLSSANKDERSAAVAQTKHTIDWAARLGAATVVLHLGSVPIEIDQREATKLIEAGQQEQAKAIITESLMKRAAERGPYIDSIITSLSELSTYAETSGIRLGLETRYYLAEIPSLDEFQMIFKNIPSPALGYWHDTGHAHVREVLGVSRQEDYLNKYGDRLIGMHIHDALGSSDHRALGCGEIDFSRIIPYVKPDTEIVLEIHRQASSTELVKSRETILRMLSGNQ